MKFRQNKRRVVPRKSEEVPHVYRELNEPLPKPWYPGHGNPLIRDATEMCMSDVIRRISAKQATGLTTDQYNAVFEAVEKIIDLIEETGK